MLKVDQNTLAEMERQHTGLVKTIMQFENAELPACPQCGSGDTAEVQVGIIGATTKAKLVPNVMNKLGKYFCNACHKFFDPLASLGPTS